MKSNRVIRAAVTVLLLASGVAAHAADAQAKPPAAAVPASTGVATYGQLDELRSQNAMLEAALKNAELRSKLAGGKSSAAQDLAGSAASARPAQPAPAPAPAAVALGLVSPAPSATVDLVASDSEGRMTAILVLDNGRKIKARVGSQIAGVGTIRSISIDEVVASVKGKTVSLPFGAEPTLGTSSAPAGGAPGMPGLSTVMPPIPAMMRGGH